LREAVQASTRQGEWQQLAWPVLGRPPAMQGLSKSFKTM
jgi:hypothetical protein